MTAKGLAQMSEWKDSRAKRVVAAITLPVFYVLNRPLFYWFAKALYDFSLRCSGFAINYKGRKGLTVGEENFLAAHLRGKTGGIYFDVGANNGAYTRVLRALLPDATIYAFEPHPVSFGFLAQQVEAERTVLVNKALSDVAGSMTLYDFEEHDGSTQASLSKEAVGLFTSTVKGHPVEVTTLDAFMAEQRIERIDLLKVDTEGFDLKVLQGATRALAERRIGVIQFEFIPANIITGVRMRDFIELLSEYQIHRVCLNGQLILLEPYDVKRCEVYVMQNLIAMPRGETNNRG